MIFSSRHAHEHWKSISDLCHSLRVIYGYAP